jgi:hypothetical protein
MAPPTQNRLVDGLNKTRYSMPWKVRRKEWTAKRKKTHLLLSLKQTLACNARQGVKDESIKKGAYLMGFVRGDAHHSSYNTVPRDASCTR